MTEDGREGVDLMYLSTIDYQPDSILMKRLIIISCAREP
jgi:hypothetical protein